MIFVTSRVMEALVEFDAELITGFAVGLEHFTGDDEFEFHWAIILSLGVLRIVMIKLKEE